MQSVEFLKIREHPGLAGPAAEWFHEKWRVPLKEYQESIAACLQKAAAVPQWYLAMEGGRIAGGLGVIENDFHDRPDLTPNVCAVYVEEDCRCRGIAGELLSFACADMASFGISTLYLLTGHDSFYERYGWEFFCMVRGDGEEQPSRMYRRSFPFCRPAAAADCEAVHRLICELEGETLPFADFARIFAEQLADPHYCCLLCDSGREIAGLLNLRMESQLHHAAKVAEILELAVTAAFRSQGIGKMLMAAACRTAKEAGCVRLEAACSRNRPGAHRFYLREGFADTHRRFSMPLNGNPR